MRKAFMSASVIAALLFSVSTSSSAAVADVTPTRVVAEGTDGYTPDEPAEPTLAGSTAVGECDGDVPWISFAVELTDPDGQSTGNTARLVITDGSNTATIELGELVDGQLSGRVLWPGASVDAAGNPTGWPGWAFVDGQWVETDENFRWTRGNISATIIVNPEVAVPLSYPPSTPQCATDPRLYLRRRVASGDGYELRRAAHRDRGRSAGDRRDRAAGPSLQAPLGGLIR